MFSFSYLSENVKNLVFAWPHSSVKMTVLEKFLVTDDNLLEKPTKIFVVTLTYEQQERGRRRPQMESPPAKEKQQQQHEKTKISNVV